MIRTLDQLFQTRTFQWLRILQFVGALCVFSFAALMPSSYVNVHHSDSSMHFLGNMLLFLSAALACYGRIRLPALLILLLPYSLAIEFAQWLTPSRQVDPRDMFVNVLGLVTGLGVVYGLEWTWRKLSSH